MKDNNQSTVDFDFNGISLSELDITLRQMYYFVIAAETGSITRSAQRLYIAQPTLSKSLQQVKDRLGVELFTPEGRGLTLTPAGQYLYHKWRSQLLQYREDLNSIGLLERETIRRITLGFFPVLNSYRFMQRYTDRIAKWYPHVSIKIERMNYIRLMEYLNANLVDLAFTLEFDLPDKKDALEWVEIIRCPMAAVISAKHPLAKENIRSLSQLAGEKLIFSEPEGVLSRQKEIDRLTNAYHINPDNFSFVNNDLTAYLAAERGEGIALGIRELYPAHNKRVILRELEEPDYAVLAVWRKDAPAEMKEIIRTILAL